MRQGFGKNLTWLWWFDFRPESIQVNDRGASSEIAPSFKSGPKWPKNNILAFFTHGSSIFLLIALQVWPTSPWLPFAPKTKASTTDSLVCQKSPTIRSTIASKFHILSEMEPKPKTISNLVRKFKLETRPVSLNYPMKRLALKIIYLYAILHHYHSNSCS